MSGTPDRLLARGVFAEEAEREGFTRFGIARAETPPRFDRFDRWIEAGRHAGMGYLEKTREIRRSPDALLAGARSIVCLAAPHSAAPRVAADGAVFARYASGADYHGTLRERALRVAARAAERLDGAGRYRVCVDSTPLAERSFAAAAGLGWIGKNGCLIDPSQGSFLLLAEILTDLDLPADAPMAERCGTCTRCLDACPTEAFVEPGVLEASRCLAYWTIEHRGTIPDGWKQALSDHVFGCDVCQEVCPWNAPLQGFVQEPTVPTRAQILGMSRGAWHRSFGKTAVNRAARRGLQRNAAASAGSRGDRTCLPVLQRTARVQEAGLADASAWALARLQRLPP